MFYSDYKLFTTADVCLLGGREIMAFGVYYSCVHVVCLSLGHINSMTTNLCKCPMV